MSLSGSQTNSSVQKITFIRCYVMLLLWPERKTNVHFYLFTGCYTAPETNQKNTNSRSFPYKHILAFILVRIYFTWTMIWVDTLRAKVNLEQVHVFSAPWPDYCGYTTHYKFILGKLSLQIIESIHLKLN